ncbi:MAG: aminotransferase class I/II-fold pyridoxal phosphate-dependent enzyme, partial [Paludibacter sp.]
NINILTQKHILLALKDAEQVKKWVDILLEERANLINKLEQLPLIQHIYPTDANFVLVKVDDANGIYQSLVDKGIIVRNRNSVSLCNGCLRITVGTSEENKILLEELSQY